MRYERTPEFAHDLKRLLKRFATLEEDLVTAQKNAIELRFEKKLDNHAIFEIQGFCTSSRRVCKLKKFACRSLPGRGVMSGIRVTFVHYPVEAHVVYLEIYFKGDKENEDKGRIRAYLAR